MFRGLRRGPAVTRVDIKPASEALGLRLDRLAPAGGLALGCALAALWLLGRRYAGISHDATIYLAMGLRTLDPGAFAKDLFFAHGGQDAYSLFPLLYAGLIAALGGEAAAQLVTLAGQLCFVAAAAVLVFRVASGPARWWALALLAVSSGYYGGVGVFRFAEPFATARTLAEPLVVAALACSLSSRHVAALALALAAAALHPLIGASGVALLFVRHALERPVLLWALPAAGAACAAVVVARPGLAHAFDPDWLEAVLQRSPHLFVAQWHLADWARVVWGLCVLGIARRFVDARAGQLLLAAGAAAIAGIAATWIAVDLLGNAFAAAVQMWRAHWLVHLLAVIVAPVAIFGLWRSGDPAAQAAAACLAASCCFGRNELAAAALLAALAIALDVSRRRFPGWMSGRALRPVIFLALLAAAAGLMFEVQSRLPALYGAPPPSWRSYLHSAASVGGLLPLAVLLWLGAYSRFSVPAAVIGAASLLFGVAVWDARAPWNRFVESADAVTTPFRSGLPRGADVFWPEPGGPAWQLLRASSWFSVDQGAGIVFNRTTALQYAERRAASRPLRESIAVCALAPSGCTIETPVAQALCGRNDAPDFLVLNAPLPGASGIEWRLPARSSQGDRLYRYSCAQIGRNEKAGARPAFR